MCGENGGGIDRVKNDRGWPCKTSIPGSNPGGASNLSV